MLVLKLIRFLMGYVKFSATGVFVERFLNLMNFHGYRIWDMKKKDVTLTAYALAKDYKQFRSPAKKTGVKLKVEEKHGAIFFARKYRKRLGFAAGIAVFFLFLSIMSNFIWVIQVEGNINVPSEDIISLMEDMGVEKGKSLKNFDFDRAQQEALLQLPQLSWLAINKIGSTVTIEVKERDLPPEIVPKNTPCHVKAAKDGQIINMEVFSGSEAAARGDMVSKGDIIISGIVQDKKGNVSIKHARANILALTQTQLEVRISRVQQEKKYTSAEKNKRTLQLFGFRIPLYIKQDPGPDYDVFTNEKKATFFGLDLPFSIETKNYKKFTVENRELTPEEMKELAYKKMEEKAEIEFKTVSVVGKEFTEEVSEEEFVLRGDYTCQENIGYEEAFDPAVEAPPPASSSEEAAE